MNKNNNKKKSKVAFIAQYEHIGKNRLETINKNLKFRHLTNECFLSLCVIRVYLKKTTLFYQENKQTRNYNNTNQ